MKYRLLGNTGVYVSEVSLGAMNFGGSQSDTWNFLGSLPVQEVDKIVGAALDAGINHIDTADIYGEGESEELLGQVLGRRRQDVILGTKVHGRTGTGPNDVGTSRLHILRALEDSLRRLKTDYIDLYQIHNWDDVTPLEEMLGAVDDAVRQGKIRYVGAANFSGWQLSKALGVSQLHNLTKLVSVQSYYSIVGRDVERDLVPMLQDSGLGLMVWGPLAGGFLTGKVSRDGSIDGPSRRAAGNFPPVEYDTAHDVLDVMRVVAARRGATIAQVALAWVLAQPAVTSVTAGARSTEQLADNVAASELTLTAEDLAELDEVSKIPLAYPYWLQQAFAPARRPV